MPTYSFRNNDTGEEFTELMSISEREKFLEQIQIFNNYRQCFLW